MLNRVTAEDWAARKLARRRMPGFIDRMADTSTTEGGVLGHTRDIVPANRAGETIWRPL